MSDKERDESERPIDYDIFDEPLVRYGGADARLTLSSGDEIDLNALRDPFTGERPSAAPLTRLQVPGEDNDAAALARIGRRLRALREDRRLSKHAVAAKAGISTARLTQVEEGNVDLGLALVTQIVRAMGARIAEVAAPDAPEISNVALAKIAEKAGAPRKVLERIAETIDPRRFADALVRAFAWTRDALLAGAPHSVVSAPAPMFKARARRAPPSDAPVLALARTLSELSAERFGTAYAGVPADPYDLRAQVADEHGDVKLQALVRWAWEHGIIVLPLDGGPTFIAAVWFVDETPVVILNESRAQAAYWLFDLAHELAHVALGHTGSTGIVDVDGPTRPDLSDEQEDQANSYALDLLLPDARSMLADVRRRTRNDAPKYFKFAVRDVAREAGISAGPLGLIAAFAMSDVPRDDDRWGSANNLATAEDPDGRSRIEAAYRERIALDQLHELDAALLDAAALPSSASSVS